MAVAGLFFHLLLEMIKRKLIGEIGLKIFDHLLIFRGLRHSIQAWNQNIFIINWIHFINLSNIGFYEELQIFRQAT